MGLFYLYTNAKIEIHICSNKHETGLVGVDEQQKAKLAKLLIIIDWNLIVFFIFNTRD